MSAVARNVLTSSGDLDSIVQVSYVRWDGWEVSFTLAVVVPILEL